MKIYPVFIPHAGCPHRCLFCAQDRSTSHETVPSPEKVNEWLDLTLPEQGDGEIAFYGGTFTLLPVDQQSLYLATAGHYLANGRVSGIRLSTRPDALDSQCLKRLKDAGVTTVEIGCQSFDDRVLSLSGRGHKSLDNFDAVIACQKADLKVGVQLMPGLPGAGKAEALMSLRQALKCKPSFLRIYPTVVVDGTGLAELWKEGRYDPFSLDEAVNVCADMFSLCRQHDMPVIRLGLQSDPQLEDNCLAGPYHPAFGQLVRSRLWRRALHRVSTISEEVIVNPADLSDVLGHRGENRTWLKAIDPEMAIKTDQSVKRESIRSGGRDWQLFDLCAQGGQNV